jgi:glutaredoxin
MRTLTLFYTPSCAFSVGALAFLALRGADVRLLNLERHPEEEERLTATLGGRKLETPTLEVDGELYVAPSLSELRDLLRGWGLPDEASPHAQLRTGGARSGGARPPAAQGPGGG